MVTVTLNELLKLTIDKDASDLHLIAGLGPLVRVYGELTPLSTIPTLDKDQLKDMLLGILNNEQKRIFEEQMELDFSYFVEGLGRFRVNMHWEKKGIGAVMRVISARIPTPEQLGLPECVTSLTNLKNGLVLVTGPTGSGKSTTLASLINKINNERRVHILTVEDPIEFIYTDSKSIIRQREVGAHTRSFAQALMHAMRQDPNVVMIGEMRDLETVSSTLTMAETGHLAFATLHTCDASQTIDRVIDVFPPYQQNQIRTMLSTSLRAVVCQQLVPCKGGVGRIASREILLVDAAISNMIREAKTPQLYQIIQTSRGVGMTTMEADLKRLFLAGKITAEDAFKACNPPDALKTICPEIKAEIESSELGSNGSTFTQATRSRF
jgi:twitching motility protein PilT